MINGKPGVLILDDEQVVCDMLYEELSEQGYLCTKALDGSSALIKLAAQDFEVVLLDMDINQGKIENYRAKIKVSFKFEG